MAGGNPNPLCGGSTDECFCPRKFRCKRHQADDLLRSIRQALEVFHGGQLVGTRILSAFVFFTEEGAFHMNAGNVGAGTGGEHCVFYTLDSSMRLLYRRIHGGGQESCYAVLDNAASHLSNILRAGHGIAAVNTVNVLIDQAGNQITFDGENVSLQMPPDACDASVGNRNVRFDKLSRIKNLSTSKYDFIHLKTPQSE